MGFRQEEIDSLYGESSFTRYIDGYENNNAKRPTSYYEEGVDKNGTVYTSTRSNITYNDKHLVTGYHEIRNGTEVTGAVKIYNIFGHVTTATPATNSLINLELYSTNASVDITAAGGAPDMISRNVGTVVAKESDSTDPLEIGEPAATPVIIENANFRSPQVPIILVKDDSADTYVQVQLSVALASGAMHWHVEWEPITDDGFIEPV